MAVTLPAVPSSRRRQWFQWWPQFSLARLKAAARTATAMPLGSQQLKRQRTSTLLSLAGVTASLLVIFAQLGIERAVYDSAIRLHRSVVGDLVLVPYGFKSLQLHGEVPVGGAHELAGNVDVQELSQPFDAEVTAAESPPASTSIHIEVTVEAPAVPDGEEQ